MGYIDQYYYTTVYKGVPVVDAELFSRLEARASDLIDQLTSYKIEDINSLPPFQQTQVKKAVAAQIEYLSSVGGELAVHGGGGVSNVSVGNFTISQESSSKTVISPAVLEYLRPTGLLYKGVNVHDSSYSNLSFDPYSFL